MTCKMTSCRAVQEDLTAWIDGELSPRWTERVRQHVAGCARCAAEADGLRASIALQRQVLPQVISGEVDTAALRARLRRAVAAVPVPPQRAWGWIFRPVVLAPACAVLAALMLFMFVGGPTDVLVPLGVAPP